MGGGGGEAGGSKEEEGAVVVKAEDDREAELERLADVSLSYPPFPIWSGSIFSFFFLMI